MTAYYNEFNPYAAQWLRNLIAAGVIAPGIVDERSIEDICPAELAGFTQCHFFAGIGVWSFALRRAGWDDSRPVWTGSCPCQPFSAAGKGAGFADERHLWPAFEWLIGECKPPVVFGEQVASRDVDPWIDLVHADLEALGYAFGGVPFPSASVGAPHIRDRAFWHAVRGDRRNLVSDGHAEKLVDASGTRLAQRERERERGILGRASGAVKGKTVIGASIRNAGGLAHAHGGYAGTEGQQRGREQRQQPENGGAVRMGNAFGTTSERHAGGLPGAEAQVDCQGFANGRLALGPEYAGAGLPVRLADYELQQRPDGESGVGDVDSAPGRQQSTAEIAGLRSDLLPGPINGFWSAADWLGCTDGKWRPVEPGTFPLVDGSAAHLGSRRADWHAAAGPEGFGHRAGRLKGYGNAINAEQARIFIEAADGFSREAEIARVAA